MSNACDIICPYHFLEERKRVSDKIIIPGLNSKKISSVGAHLSLSSYRVKIV